MKKIVMLALVVLMISVAVPVTIQAKTSAQTRITQTEKKIKKRFKRIKIVTRTKHNFNKIWKQTAHRKGKGYYIVEKFQGTALNKYIGRDPNGYYTSYRYVKGVRKESKVITYLVYCRHCNEPDDIVARYDVVIKY